eukprot:919417-Rhodomonas_salina.1
MAFWYAGHSMLRGVRYWHSVCSTAIMLHTCYAVSSTDIPYAAPRHQADSAVLRSHTGGSLHEFRGFGYGPTLLP